MSLSFASIFAVAACLNSALSSTPPQVPLPEVETPLQPPIHHHNSYEDVTAHGPHLAHARSNAPRIFNAIHSSMRQWGSSVQHNGMSFFPAIVPNNTLLYHGTHTPERVKGMEWLAFEIEHAELFAFSWPRRRRPPEEEPGDKPGRGPPSEPSPFLDLEQMIEAHTDLKRDEPSREENVKDKLLPPIHGYLHTYRTTRPLSRLLYVDGMSAAKTFMGTLDTQDLVLLSSSLNITAPRGDYQRALQLCALGKEWGVEGIIRMEAGFEIIFCDFENLEVESIRQRPDFNTSAADMTMQRFEYVRGVSARYQGIGGGRVQLDYSAMVSAFWYPLNLTNPDSRKKELPRLPKGDMVGLDRLKKDVRTSLEESWKRGGGGVQWQEVVDMIVLRYSDRLKLLALDSTTEQTMLSEINILLNNFIDYSETKPDLEKAVDNCVKHFFTPVIPRTEQDGFIFEAVMTVSKTICQSLFDVRNLLLNGSAVSIVENEETSPQAKVTKTPKGVVEELIEYLDWSKWLECGKCAWDEVCFVAIWPMGGAKDHYEPGCVKDDGLGLRLGGKDAYWDFDLRRP